MMKSVLIISAYFAPQNAIGAVRPTKLAKYLTRMGYRVTVLCAEPYDALRDPLLERDLRELTDVHTITEHSLFRRLKTRGAGDRDAPGGKPATKSSAPKKKKGLRDTAYLWLYQRADRAFARACIRELVKMDRRFDAVLSTYGPAGVHIAARAAKRRGIAGRWIADFRDGVSVPFAWQKGGIARYLRGVRQDADAVTGVSAGFLDIMGFGGVAHVIPNGYDREDLRELAPFPVEEDALTFAYCGRLHKGRSLMPVYRAVRALIDEGSCEASRFRFHYAGRQSVDFLEEAKQAGFAGAVVDHGMLPRSGSLGLQRAADVLLVALFNNEKRSGVLTGKLLEYLMAGKPILCCASGKYAGSAARQLMEGVRCGFCYEQAQAEKDAPSLKAYILALYNARFAGGPNPYRPDETALTRYGYEHIAQTFAGLIETVV